RCPRLLVCSFLFFFFFQAEDGIRDFHVTGVQTCALPICHIYADLFNRIQRYRRPTCWHILSNTELIIKVCTIHSEVVGTIVTTTYSCSIRLWSQTCKVVDTARNRRQTVNFTSSHRRRSTCAITVQQWITTCRYCNLI